MNKYEERMKLLNKKFGKGIDNVILLATLSNELRVFIFIKPCVNDVNAYDEADSLYIETYALKKKVKQIELNLEVAKFSNFADFYENDISQKCR